MVTPCPITVAQAAHAQRLDDGYDGVGDIYRRKPQIPDAVSHKKAVHDRINPRQGKG